MWKPPLRAGILEDGIMTASDSGTGQGSAISPMLANVYLHYVFDLWADRWRRRHARGDVIIVRFADDYIVGFEHRRDAQRFIGDLRGRLEPRRQARTLRTRFRRDPKAYLAELEQKACQPALPA